MNIYLAGGMKDGWQDRFASLADPCWTLFDPRSHGFTEPSAYTAWDLAHVRDADVVLVHMSSGNPSGFGLSVELGYAYGLGKRLIFVDEVGADWRSRYFDMHRVMADEVVPSLDAAVAALRGAA